MILIPVSYTHLFTAIGDPQLGKPLDQLDSQKNIWHKVLNKIKYHFPDSSLLVSLGDQVNNYDAQEAYAALLDQGCLLYTSTARMIRRRSFKDVTFISTILTFALPCTR